MSHADDDRAHQHPFTRLVRSGRDPDVTGPFVNPPVVHASTVLFETVASMHPTGQRYTYGRHGTPTTVSLEDAVSELEGAAGTVLCPSGLAAISVALMSVLEAGDHLLMSDSVYGPARHVASTVLKRFGVETTFFDPLIGADIASLFTERTKAVYLESPGSLTFEMQDLPAIATVAKARGAVTLADNTWATGLYCKPLALGSDLSIQAGTKYLVGHSDAMLGTVSANEATLPKLRATHGTLGLCAAPDDVYLALRGLRTLGIRLAQQMQSALTVARWLSGRREVARVLHPALPSDPGHALWKRDMTGASGLFSFVLDGWTPARAAAFLEGLRLFGLGYSWGGFESLATLPRPETIRTATRWQAEGPLVRMHIGLEDPADLIADIEASLVRHAVTAAVTA